ncbi:hypothetical protein GCM10023325_00870 [Sphingomonas lutea]
MDCQADLLDSLPTRFVVPLIAHSGRQAETRRLHPLFIIEGQQYVMATHLAGAVAQKELGEVVTSLRDHHFDIIDALDVLLGGV